MIKLPMSDERYQEILARLEDPSLKVRLSSNPTVMGPQYICDKIVEILSAKSVVNDLMEEVERAYTQAQILVHHLQTELDLLTHIEINGLEDGAFRGLNAAQQKVLIRERVDKAYRKIHQDDVPEGDPELGPFELWEDIRSAEEAEIELKGLMSMLERRRDELNKQDSGVRLQQKTIADELRIQKNALAHKVGQGEEEPFDGILPPAEADPDFGGDEEDGEGHPENLQIPESSGVV